MVLRGHAREVTGVAWCPTDPLQLATCGDDASVRVWALARRQLSHSPQAGRGPPCAEAGHLRADMAPPTPVLAARLRVSGAAPATAPAAGAQRLVGSPDGRAGVMSPQRAPFTPRVPDAQLPAVRRTALARQEVISRMDGVRTKQLGRLQKSSVGMPHESQTRDSPGAVRRLPRREIRAGRRPRAASWRSAPSASSSARRPGKGPPAGCAPALACPMAVCTQRLMLRAGMIKQE